MQLIRLCVVLAVFTVPAAAQLTIEQKVDDFRYLSALYAKNYAPYEWKRDTQNFDLLELDSWLEKVRATKNDLEFYDLMVRYVASLNDAHDTFVVPSSFVARLNFTTDVYDGKVLIDSINRTRLPVTEFPFQIGDEVVSIDGKPAAQWLEELAVYSVAANPRSTRRIAAGQLTTRSQQVNPFAVNVGDVAVVTIRDAQGDLTTHRVPWTKTGLPLTRIGPVPELDNWRGGAAEFEDTPSYLEPLLRLQNTRISEKAVLNFGGRAPIFQLPENFVQRLGRSPSDFFFSGTYTVGGTRIGFIRIPTFSPPDANLAINQFAGEMLYFDANTDGLIVDVMRNPGGNVAVTNILAQLLMPRGFRAMGFEVRATSWWVVSFSNSVVSARAQGAPEHTIALLESILNDVRQANREYRGRTGPIPLDDITLDRAPLRDAQGRVVAYSKPVMVLTDEMSASGGDAFPATIQNNRRGVLFGIRTMGAGGSVSAYTAGPLSEGQTSMTESLMHRGETITAEGYPASPYVENVGVHPDIVQDYMTRRNLMERGRPFVEAFTAAMIEHIRRSR